MSVWRVVTASIIALGLGLSGCGGGDDSTQTSTDPSVSSSAAAESEAAAGSAGDQASAASETKTGAASGQEPSVPAPTLPPNYVRASVATNGVDDPTLADCRMTRGEQCTAHFRGRYLLRDHPSGAIRVAVFEDGASEPSYRADLPIARRGGSQFFVDLPFKISATVRKLTFRTYLLGPRGEVIDRWGNQTFEVP